MSIPGTTETEPNEGSAPQWDDAATLHRGKDSGGVFADIKAVRHGTLAELVRFVAALPEDEQEEYMIEKTGDHTLRRGEILALSRRADFPRG
jgi:hypothetical protein